MAIKHPYHFVPFREQLAREAPQRYPAGGLSGTFVCRLRTLTPLCLKAHFAALHQQGQSPFLTGSSLKGTVRSFLQMLGAGCGMNYEYKADKGKREPKAPELGPFSSCTKGQACAVCRIFGYVAGDFGWGAKVRFRDSSPLADWKDTLWKQMPNVLEGGAKMAKHGPFRESFYGSPAQPAGWKVYLHSRAPAVVNIGFASENCVPAGREFDFSIDYAGLTDEEYALLRFGICLKHGETKLHHKVGYGKPLGYGSCLVEILEGGSGVPSFDLEPLLSGAQFDEIRQYCDFAQAADQLLYHGGWLRDNPLGTIDEYENWLLHWRPRVQPPPPAPKREEPDNSPKLQGRVKVRVTSIKNNIAKASTVELYGPPASKRQYQTSFKVSPFDKPAVGAEVEVTAGNVDDKNASFGATYP